MAQKTTQDLEALPNNVLRHILSFLDMKEVVKTSVLSKRWRTFIPKLNFQNYDASEEAHRFVLWVYRMLLRCLDTSIEEFEIEFPMDSYYASAIDAWVCFVLERNVKNMTICYPDSSCRVPQFVFRSSSLINLSLSCCEMVPKGYLRWTSLKSLSIADVKLNDDIVIKILSGSPMLEYLKISRSSGFHHLEIKSERLKELVIDGYLRNAHGYMEILAPRLQSLHLLGFLFTEIRLLSVSSLLRADLRFFLYLEENNDGCENQLTYITDLLGSLHHVQELELELDCIQALVCLEAKALTSQLSSLTCLKLKYYNAPRDVLVIISLLKGSPNIETLVVNTARNEDSLGPSVSNRVKNFWMSNRRIKKFGLPHLKTVKLLGFKNVEDVDKYTLELIQFLLENAPLLGRIDYI